MQVLAQAQSDGLTAQKKFRAGDAPRLDVIRARVTTAQAGADLDSARVDVANAVEALAVEAGVPVSTLQKLEPDRASKTALPVPTEPQQAVALALQRRPDIASASEAVEAERSAVLAASRGKLPSLTVNAGYTTGIDSGVQVHGPSANVTASFPLSNGPEQKTNAERARLAQAQAKADAVQRQVTLEVASAARSYRASGAAVTAAAGARQAAEEELRATETGYRSGASSSLDVADAGRTYVQAALLELDAIYAQAQAAALLEEAIGP